MASYKNSFYNPVYQDSKATINTNAEPVEYNGYFIYHRLKTITSDANIFDIVKDGICVGMYAGINGAKKSIDAHLTQR